MCRYIKYLLYMYSIEAIMFGYFFFNFIFSTLQCRYIKYFDMIGLLDLHFRYHMKIFSSLKSELISSL